MTVTVFPTKGLFYRPCIIKWVGRLIIVDRGTVETRCPKPRGVGLNIWVTRVVIKGKMGSHCITKCSGKIPDSVGMYTRLSASRPARDSRTI